MLRVSRTLAEREALGCGDIEEASEPPSDGVENEVERFLDSYRLAVETRDGPLLRTMYVDDGRFEWIEDGEVRYRSPNEVLAALATLPNDAVMRTEYTGVEVVPVGDTGARVTFQFQTVFGQGPSVFEFGGMSSLVVEKTPTGWRIVGGHTSSSGPGGR